MTVTGTENLLMAAVLADGGSHPVSRVLASGWGGLRGQDLPDQLFAIEQVPHDWLFPRCAAVVHHGGAGVQLTQKPTDQKDVGEPEISPDGRYLTGTLVGVSGQSKLVRIDRGAIRQAATYDGKWVIETNDDTISLEDAACGYKGLMVIERCFRSLKRTQIRMTPMYH